MSWVELCCFGCLSISAQLVRKWLNISTRDSDFGADTDVEDDADVDTFYDPEGILKIFSFDRFFLCLNDFLSELEILGL